MTFVTNPRKKRGLFVVLQQEHVTLDVLKNIAELAVLRSTLAEAARPKARTLLFNIVMHSACKLLRDLPIKFLAVY